MQTFALDSNFHPLVSRSVENYFINVLIQHDCCPDSSINHNYAFFVENNFYSPQVEIALLKNILEGIFNRQDTVKFGKVIYPITEIITVEIFLSQNWFRQMLVVLASGVPKLKGWHILGKID